MRKILSILFLLIVSFHIKAQLINDSLLIEGNYRSFHFNKPVQINHPSLVFVLHGSGGTGKGMMKSALKMEEIASKENAIIVYPDGYKNYWNECRRLSPAAANVENVNEQAFFSGMIEYFKLHYAIDDKKVFAVGTSGGGHMAYKLALTMPGKFKAITAIIANLPDTNNMDCVATGKPIAMMIINGTDDKTNPYNGGDVVLGKNMDMGYVRSTDRTFRYWADLAGYLGEPKTENLPDKDPNDGKTIVKYWFKEKEKPEIVLLKVIGGHHDYPNDIDVHVTAWEFFKTQLKGD
jgi:polyhydroxybutyrate depolymerase